MFRRWLRKLMPMRLKPSTNTLTVVRVTPHPEHAAELERRFNQLAYYPENGFHRDRIQDRRDAPFTRRR